MEDHNEIQEIMSRSYGMDDIDEGDLEAGEFDELFYCEFCLPRLLLLHTHTEFDALDIELGDESLNFLDDAATVPTALPGEFNVCFLVF